MISQKLVEMIEKNADLLTKRMMKDLLERKETSAYKQLPEKDLYTLVHDVYSRLDSWLGKDKERGRIKDHYSELGSKRFREGIPLYQVIMALMLTKRHLWLFIQEQQFFDSAYELNQSLELNNRVVLFFDRAIYFTAMGYETEMRKSSHT